MRDYDQFMVAFNKRFTLLDSAEAARDVLKQIKQGKGSVVEYQARFDQFTAQTGWSDGDHCIRFYDSLSKAIKDNLTISDCLMKTLVGLRQAAQILDQRMHQQQAVKMGKSMHPQMQQSSSKNSDAVEVDTTQQQQSEKEICNRKTYVAFMRGKCYDYGSTDHTKANGNHE